MKIPKNPLDEPKRQRDLESYNILDTLPEKDFDDLTKVAAQICGAPISLVSLVDKNRQWFKSAHGLDATETPRKYAFCAHAIHHPQDVLMIEDARKHPDFKGNPLVNEDPNVVFYAGAPLVSENGHALGTLCVIDNKPNTLSTSQIDSLKSLARQVVSQLDLRKQNRELRSVNFNLEVAQSKLKLKNEEVEQFVYVASHDLQEPLRTITSMSDIILEDYADLVDEEGKQYLSFMNDASYRMKELISCLLDHSRLGKDVELETINFNAITESVIKDLNDQIEKSNAIITTDDHLPDKMTGFAVNLRQLLQNLLSNALKFKKEGAIPEIIIRYQNKKQFHEFSIEDNGIGIPEKYQKKIFVIFKRLHGNHIYEGIGMGLANCKKIVELHQGTIDIESDGENGSKFIFTIKKNLK